MIAGPRLRGVSRKPPVVVPSQTRNGSATAGSTRPAPEVLEVLCSAVDGALAMLGADAPPGPVLESMLTAFTERVAPVRERIADSPDGSLRIVQCYLGNAFAHAVEGDVAATRSALIAARVALARFFDDEPDTERRWFG